MSPRNRKLIFGGVLPLVSACVACGAIVLASLAAFGARNRPARVLEEPEPVEIAAVLARVGIAPETLAAVGATDQQVGQLVAYARSHLNAAEFGAIEQADEAVKSAEQRRRELSRLVQGGKGTSEDVTALRAAEQTLASIRTSRQALLDAVATAIRTGLDQEQVGTLARFRANSGWDLPVQYKVAARTEEEWVALRDALANLRVNPRFDEEVDPRCAALIARCDGEAGVAAAKALLDSRLAQVTAAFELALGLDE